MKPRILIFIDWYKPGYKAGGPIRSISNLVDYLYQKSEIYIITRDTDYLETEPYLDIKPNDWNDIDNSKVFYLSNQTTNYKYIKKLIQDIEPNTIYCNSLYSPYFTLIPLYISKTLKINRILATRGMLSSGALAIKSTKKKVFLFISKRLGIFKDVVFHATSEDEKKDIEKHFKNPLEIVTLQNLGSNQQIVFKEKTKEINSINLVYVGRISPEKNTLFSLKTIANCKQKVQFDLFGPIYNDEYWKECKLIIENLPKNIHVTYKGVLHHNLINETLQNYHALLLPSTGENYGHIIIESMINSCIPIISTNTPWKDLEAKGIGYDIELSNPNRFSEVIDELARLNKPEFNNKSTQTHQFAEKILDNTELVEGYLHLFKL